jgi:general secretion pathway protein A
MYRNFFSLSELPFSISPDPKYLFMSERHREALTQLTYGLGEVGGFALLTGEVGTGKTTISRCLVDQLSDVTQVAFILNPTLSSQELLATLCDELKISYLRIDPSLKNLTDKISEKLLINHENGISTLLIIDEAQHLKPEVLEQLRLLTNLETNTKKLLQIVLIGQPELQQLLQRRDLRQLAQRITARYHLMPLTKQELKQYIQHRLTVADCVRPIFDKGALNKIHQLSQGIPRLINLLCHSSLLLAYNQNDSVVNKKTVIAAADKALGENVTSKKGTVDTNKILLLTTVLSVTAIPVLAGLWWDQTPNPIKNVTVSNPLEEAKNVHVPPEKNKTSVVDKRYESTPTNTLYTVRSGDTLYRISIMYNIRLNALRQWNNITEKNKLNVGDVLYVINPKNISHAVLSSKHEDKTNLSQENTKQVTPLLHDVVKIQNKALSITKPANKSKLDETLVISANKPSVSSKKNQERNYQVTKVDGVSNDLLARFQAAIDETKDQKQPQNSAQKYFSSEDEHGLNERDQTNFSGFDDDGATNIKPLSQMSQKLQNSLPNLQFEQHIYSSDGEGWVTVNGKDRYEGDYIADSLVVDKILPQQVILSFKGERFSLPALTNW